MVEAEKPDSIGYFAGTGSGTPAPLLGCGFINSVSAASGEWSNIDVGPVTEADWRDDLFKPSDVPF